MTPDEDDEIAREIQTHLALETEELMADGLSERDAATAARRAFGSVAHVQEDVRAVHSIRWLEELARDIRHGCRRLLHARTFTAVVVLTLGLAIGANAAIFSLINQVILQPLPVPNPSELVLLNGPGPYQGRTTGGGSRAFSGPMFRGLEEASRPVMSGLLASTSAPCAVTIGSQSERAAAELVSGSYFRTLGVPAAAGRIAGDADDTAPGRDPVVVLSYGFWQRRFAGASVVGTSIGINGRPFVIIGVAARGFTGIDRGASTDLFVPMTMKAVVTPTADDLASWRTRSLTILGRLKPGIDRAQAAAALTVAYRQLLQEDVKTARIPAELRPQFLAKSLVFEDGAAGRPTLRARFASPLFVLMAMVALVLLIACVNIAGLLLARASAEAREVAVRLSLGSGRIRVVRRRVVEVLVLSLAGTMVGLFFAAWATRALLEALPLGRALEAISPSPDARVALFAAAAALLTAMACGIGPSLYATRPVLSEVLKQTVSRASGSRRETATRRLLVVAQVALSIVLLGGAGLFARTFYNLQSLDPGFDAGRLVQFRIDAANSGYRGERTAALFARMQEALGALPGVTSASLAIVPALSNTAARQTIRVDGYVPGDGDDMSPTVNWVGPAYFATVGMPLVAGREFQAGDAAGAPRVAIVNETMARYFWNGRNAVGQRFGRSTGPGGEIEVVGVVRDAKFEDLKGEIPRAFYLPYAQNDALNSMTFYVRSQASPETRSTAIRGVVSAIDPALPVYDLRTVEEQRDALIAPDRLVAGLAVFFAAAATALAAMGLYGLIAFSVAQRTREIGIRLALGARRATVLGMVFRDAALLLAVGIAAGLPLLAFLGQAVRSQLFGVSSLDGVTVVSAVGIVSIVALAAGCFPAWRATRVNPVVALRYE